MSSILLAAEQAVQLAIQTELDGTNVTFLLSDEGDIKPPMPYIVGRATEFEEQISPGSGIFKVRIRLEFKSHVKATTPEEREAIIVKLNNFAYTNPAETLSAMSGFHCYGFVPTTGAMTIDADQKAYVYGIEYDLHCMPRDNA